MPTYIVKSPIRHDGEDYAPGEQIDLSAKQAQAMPWAVAPAKKEAAPAADANSNGDGGKK